MFCGVAVMLKIPMVLVMIMMSTDSFGERDVVKKQFWRTDQFCGVAEDKDKADREEQGRHHLSFVVKILLE